MRKNENTKNHLEENGSAQVLELKDIVKIFPGVKALDGVSMTIKRGRVHALMGENGAGKSTLMKVLSGVYRKDGGEILIDGGHIEIKNPMDSEKYGIAVIYQEFALVPELSITQNIFLGKELRKHGILDVRGMNQRARELMKRFDMNVNVTKRAVSYTHLTLPTIRLV